MHSDDFEPEQRIYHRHIEPDEWSANIDLIEVVAEIEGCDTEDLPSLWASIDDIVQDVFSDPPGPQAQVHVQFTYAGYRIDVDQTGHVELMKVADWERRGR